MRPTPRPLKGKACSARMCCCIFNRKTGHVPGQYERTMNTSINKWPYNRRMLWLGCLWFGVTITGTAQNLVPNPGFEDTTLCNVWDPLRSKAAHWYNVNTATPDIWDCDTVRRCGNVMDPNDLGIQHKGYLYSLDGDRHAGGWHWSGLDGSNTKEYLMCALSDSLVQGARYLVSLNFARPEGHSSATDRIGVWFGPDSVFFNTPNTLPLLPQVELMKPNGGYLRDSVWTYLSDTLVADGGERWMVFGTFIDDSLVNGISIPPGFWPYNTYYYVDMVSVVPIDDVGIVDASDMPDAWYYAEGRVHFHGGYVQQLQLFDVTGRLCGRWADRSGAVPLSIPDLSEGVYVITGLVNGERRVLKFVKE